MKKILLVAFLSIFTLPVYANPNLSHLSDTYVCSWFEVLRVPQQFIDEAKKRNLKCGEPRVKFKVECGSNSIFANSRCEKIPENATYSDEGWSCNTGYVKQLNTCIIKQAVPPNGYKKGTSFACVTGYYKKSNSCRRLPLNAIALSGSDGYYCKPNYRMSTSQNNCVEHSPAKGNAVEELWLCPQGYTRIKNTCVEGSILKDNSFYTSIFKDNHSFFLVFFNSGKPTIYFWLALIFSALALDNIFSLKRKRKESRVKLAEIKLAEIKQSAEKAKIKEAVDLANVKLEQEKAKFRAAEIERKKEEAKAKLAEKKQIADKAKADKAKADKAIADKAIADKAIADKAKADKAIADKAIADKAIADKAKADKAIADKEKIIEAEAKLVNPSVEADFKPLMINENSNKSEIVDYSKKFIGKSLRDIITKIQESNLEDQYYSYRRYFALKEDRGLMTDIERVCEKASDKDNIFEELLDKYGFNIQSDSQSANHLVNNNIFLKKIPATMESKYIFLNNLHLSSIDFYEIIDEIWENSSLYNELQNLLIVVYEQPGYLSPLDYRVIGVKSPNLINDLPDYLLSQIKKDWELIRDKVKDGRAHFITDKQTKYLIAQNDDRIINTKVRQPNNTNKASPKIFCLKKEFVNLLFAVESLSESQIKNNESDDIANQSLAFTSLDKDGKRKTEKIPKLQPSGREREFIKYELSVRSNIVKDFLFKGISHRELDENILGLDPTKSKGFQSMGILHYLGLKKPFSELFYNLSLERVNELLTEDFQDFDQVLEHINFSSELGEGQDSFNMNHPHYGLHKDFNSLFHNYLGKSEEQIADFLNLSLPSNKPKNFRRVLVDNIIKTYGQYIDQTDRVIKVIKLESSGKLTQSIPLPTFRYLDIVNEKWGTSELFKQLTQYFTFIVFKEEEDSNSSALLKVISWTISTEDLREAQKVWEKTVSQINLKKADELPKMSESNVLHVRPHAQNKMDTFPTHYGEAVIKKSFWLNAKFIETIVRDYD
ncbi:MutH/Sau3AI family endonuclease [Candidatus Pseudothioglobus sp. Uisw_041]|uniref:MutH/Sau3AI family endonuclease n=1 Tax=Candidatus Pseudothioglobus sp. Uisw_041 TaxID=3230996 RepID=UPI003A8B9101